MYRILLVEDDCFLAEAIKEQLCHYGFEVDIIKDFTDILPEFRSLKPDLVLMDIMLPCKDGYFFCAEIRKESSVPVVFISSSSDNMNIIMAINMGGDDFIKKPVDKMVLTAKIQAILRRTYELPGNALIIRYKDASLNLSDSSLNYCGIQTELTKNELRILQTLLENRGKTVTREVLMTRLWQSDLYIEENTLNVNIARLRKKLDECGLSEVILTRPGSGYIIL